MKNLINWKLFSILLITCVITSMLVIPYSLALTSSQVKITPETLLLSAAQNLLLFALAIFFGLLLLKHIKIPGMGLPFLTGALEGKNQAKGLKAILLPSIGLGVLAGVLIILLDFLFKKFTVELQNIEVSIAAWKAILASFYGGIAEEVLLRLFMLTLLVWLIFKIIKVKEVSPNDLRVWAAIVLAAVIFGLGHLPATSQITDLTVLVVIRAIVLNGVGGIIFGWLYWKKGLESAILAHFSADIVLHVILPAIV